MRNVLFILWLSAGALLIAHILAHLSTRKDRR